MENIILIIGSALFLIVVRFIFAYIKKEIFLKKSIIEGIFDLLGLSMIYIYPFIFDLLLIKDGSGSNGYILQWPLSFRVVLALLLLFLVPSLLSFIKKLTLNKFLIPTSSYFWIENMIYFLFVIPIILIVMNGVLNKYLMLALHP